MSAADGLLYVPARTPLLRARHAITDALSALEDGTTIDALERLGTAQSNLANAVAVLEARDPAAADLFHGLPPVPGDLFHAHREEGGA